MQMNIKLSTIVLSMIVSPIALPLTSTAENTVLWRSCTQDSDCVLVGQDCAIHSVNSAFAAEAGEFYKLQDAAIICPASNKPYITTLRASCTQQRIPCVKKKFFGLVEEGDHASTCISLEKICELAMR